MLAATKISDIVDNIKNLVSNARCIADASDLRLDWGLTFDQDLVDTMFVANLKKYHFVLDSINVDPHQVKTKLSLAAFAAPIKETTFSKIARSTAN